jgi:hypothetical protein
MNDAVVAEDNQAETLDQFRCGKCEAERNVSFFKMSVKC